MSILKTGSKYYIGAKLYEVVIEQPELSCIEQCDIKDCTCHEDMIQFKKACGCETCIQLLGIGRCFKYVEGHDKKEAIHHNL